MHALFQNLITLKFWHNSVPKMLHKGTGQGLQQISLSNFSPLSIYPLIWIILKRCKSNQRDTDFYLKDSMSRRVSTEKLGRQGVAQHRTDARSNGQILLTAVSPCASRYHTLIFSLNNFTSRNFTFFFFFAKLFKQECSPNLIYELSENGKSVNIPGEMTK